MGYKNLVDVDVINAVHDLTAANVTFSAYNVVEKLRNDGYFANKDFVNPLVHNEMVQMSTYSKNWKYDSTSGCSFWNYEPLINVSNTPLLQNVVVSSQLQPSVGQPTPSHFKTPIGQSVNVAQFGTPTISHPGVTKGDVNIGSERRVTITNKYLKKLGIGPNEDVYIYDNGTGNYVLTKNGGHSFTRKVRSSDTNSIRLRMIGSTSSKATVMLDMLNTKIMVNPL